MSDNNKQYDIDTQEETDELTKKERLEAKDWKVGTVSEFLELTQEESTLIEMKLSLSRSLNERRKRLMTQR